jgi:hypothetical protein
MQLARRFSSTADRTATTDTKPLLVGFLAVQFLLGYEWLMSGLAKVAADDFPGGLAQTLTDATQGQTGWYKSFIDGVVIPNGPLFGSLVMLGEVVVGVTLIAASLAWLARWGRLGSGAQVVLLAVVALAGVVGAFMSLNFHLAMGATAPWVISPDPNDQGVDLDSLMFMLQVVLAIASVAYLVRLRRGSVS